MFNMPKGPFCQSCGIPLDKAQFGTNEDGSQNDIYCEYCFQNGEFVAPDLTMDDMIDKVTEVMIEKLKIPGFQASMLSKMYIPQLKRWKNN